jgi:hypothetical protein
MRGILVKLVRRQRHARTVGSWLAFAAVLIQALIPNIVAVEIALAADAGIAVGFLECPFGHVHEAALAPATGGDRHADTGAPADDPTDRQGLTDGCSICLALHTGGQFTAPVVFHVAAPYPLPRAVLVARHHDDAAALFVHAGYNARAPPRLG